MVEGKEVGVLIQGRPNLNRALHDDVVAVKLLPKEQWAAPSNVIIDQEKEQEDKVDDGESEDKEKELLSMGKSEGNKQQTGQIVGIVKRKWRQYCGIIRKNEIAEVS